MKSEPHLLLPRLRDKEGWSERNCQSLQVVIIELIIIVIFVLLLIIITIVPDLTMMNMIIMC